MKYVKFNFRDILFYAPNWSDEKGTSYGRFSGFLSHKIEISENKNILGTFLEQSTAVLVHFCHTKLRFQKIKMFWALPWKNLRLLMWPKNPISSYFGQNSEMQNCQDYTDPTVVPLFEIEVWNWNLKLELSQYCNMIYRLVGIENTSV